jgi:uncharacterized membrane protein
MRPLHLIAAACRFTRCDRGSVAIIAALAFPVLIGGMGLGAEVGYWYMKQQEMQHAADVAAHAAGVRLVKKDPKATLDAVALNIATQSGFAPASGIIKVNWPPVNGRGAGDKQQVEVIITQKLHRAFSTLFGRGDVRVSGRSVAKISGSTICSLALNTTSNSALQVRSSSSVNFQNCVVASNSRSSSSYQTGGRRRRCSGIKSPSGGAPRVPGCLACIAFLAALTLLV